MKFWKTWNFDDIFHPPHNIIHLTFSRNSGSQAILAASFGWLDRQEVFRESLCLLKHILITIVRGTKHLEIVPQRTLAVRGYTCQKLLFFRTLYISLPLFPDLDFGGKSRKFDELWQVSDARIARKCFLNCYLSQNLFLRHSLGKQTLRDRSATYCGSW